jgi:lysozyme
MRRLALPIGLAVAMLALAAALWLVARDWRPSVSDYQFQGVDVSDANGAVDWDAVKAAGADFGYARATLGGDRDPRFEDNWHGIAEAGMRRGAIHAWSLCRLAADQANNFNTTVPKADDALPSAVEVDFIDGCNDRPSREIVLEELKRFIIMVEAHTQRPVLLLVSKRFEANYSVTAALDRPVWSAQNFFPPDYAARPWRMWRASDMRRVDGVEGPVNWDVVTK